MAQAKTTSNPPPNIDFRALYPWASAELLPETSTLNSSEDIRKHREGEPDCKRKGISERERRISLGSSLCEGQTCVRR